MKKIIKEEFVISGKQKPVWIMRQAGRYLIEYMNIRKNFSSFMDFCFDIEAVTKTTLIPIEIFDFDAAIIFSDILTIPFALGQKVDFKENEGPVLGELNINKLTSNKLDQKLSNVYQAISATRLKLNDSKSLIGFSGNPFTLSCYMLKNSKTKDFSNVLNYVYSEPKSYEKLIDILTESVTEHIKNQIKSGCDIIQLFESWASIANEEIFNKFIIEPTKKIISNVKKLYPNTPIIAFPRGAGVKYKQFADNIDIDGIAIDQFTPLKWACENISSDILIQGNLDPILLSSNITNENLSQKVLTILETMKGRKFIFNLGHGILPDAKRELVKEIINTIRT